jgi:hypothetical protein
VERTKVMVCFSIYGDTFPLDYVTEKLGITPTNTYGKGDVVPNRSTTRYRLETTWDLGTDYQESLDVNEQLHQIINQLRDKVTIINKIKKAYPVECKFFIVIIIEEGYTPALYLNKEVINFASSIEAEVDIDLYANPYESDID